VHTETPNLFFVLDLGHTYRRYVDELLQCHKALLMALHKFERHALLSQVFIFTDDMIQRVLGQSMHFLHGYFAVYEPSPALMDCPVRNGLLLACVLGFAIKVATQDYVLEHLPIREQLLLFDVAVPPQSTLPETYGGATFAKAAAHAMSD